MAAGSRNDKRRNRFILAQSRRGKLSADYWRERGFANLAHARMVDRVMCAEKRRAQARAKLDAWRAYLEEPKLYVLREQRQALL
jgi:hypothetical protein